RRSAVVTSAGTRSPSTVWMRARTLAIASTASSVRKMQRSNSALFWPVLVLVATIDFCTKALAANRLLVKHLPHDILGETVRFTLVYNPGAAFGLHVGQ